MENKTAFIIGTGPSLKKIDIGLLKDKRTITFNRAYIAFEDWGFEPTYYLSIDGNDIRSMYKDLNNLIENSNIEKFFLYKLTDNESHGPENFQDNEFKSDDEIYKISEKVYLIDDKKQDINSLIDTTQEGNIISTNVLPNAGFLGLKMLYFLGYRRIILVGMDTRYSNDAEEREVTVRGNSYESKEDDDSNHFRPDYNGKNFCFGKPNQKEIIKIWNHLMSVSIPSDLEIISCTEDSNLNEFIKYIPFDEFMSDYNLNN